MRICRVHTKNKRINERIFINQIRRQDVKPPDWF
jgi:hypothetical protein